MDKAFNELVKQMIPGNVKQSGTFKAWNGAIVLYYVVESDELTLRFWNSSNSQEPHGVGEILNTIREKVLNEITGGNFTDEWMNEIQWEVLGA